MAKKQVLEPELTPAQQVRKLAYAVVELEAQLKETQEKMDEYKAKIKEYLDENENDTNLEALTAERRLAKPTIDFGGLTPAMKKKLEEQLRLELPQYCETKTSLNVEQMFFALETDAVLRNALTVRNLKIEQTASWTLKKAK